jgi:hypothetical protein
MAETAKNIRFNVRDLFDRGDTRMREEIRNICAWFALATMCIALQFAPESARDVAARIVFASFAAVCVWIAVLQIGYARERSAVSGQAEKPMGCLAQIALRAFIVVWAVYETLGQWRGRCARAVDNFWRSK